MIAGIVENCVKRPVRLPALISMEVSLAARASRAGRSLVSKSVGGELRGGLGQAGERHRDERLPRVVLLVIVDRRVYVERVATVDPPRQNRQKERS